MPVKYHYDLIQCTEPWYAARCGLLTASEMEHAISRKTDRKTGEITYKTPDKEKNVAHLYELLAQRVTNYVEPVFIGHDMLRGKEDEIDAKVAYEKEYKVPIRDCGFITNDKFGFTLGFSPDGLVADDGIIEVKSRCQKYQVETLLDGTMPDDFVIQVQTGLLVSERKWCDFISYCGGMLMVTIRVEADLAVHATIIEAAQAFHNKLDDLLNLYKTNTALNFNARLIPTVRRPPEQEIHL